MEIEEEMYVRTPLRITKISKIDNNKSKWKYLVGKKNCGDGTFEYDALCEEVIVKASYDIIDLIEVGDYVNGEYTDLFNIDYFRQHPEHIKSLVTKEQFEEISYKVD